MLRRYSTNLLPHFLYPITNATTDCDIRVIQPLKHAARAVRSFVT